MSGWHVLEEKLNPDQGDCAIGGGHCCSHEGWVDRWCNLASIYPHHSYHTQSHCAEKWRATRHSLQPQDCHEGSQCYYQRQGHHWWHGGQSARSCGDEDVVGGGGRVVGEGEDEEINCAEPEWKAAGCGDDRVDDGVGYGGVGDVGEAGIWVAQQWFLPCGVLTIVHVICGALILIQTVMSFSMRNTHSIWSKF